MTGEPKKRFVVERSKWLRGDSIISRLLDSRGHMCCLGFCASQLGVGDDALLDVGEPRDIDPHDVAFDAVDGVLVDIYESDDIENVERRNSKLANRAIDINDSPEINDADRESLLSKLFAKHGYELTFVDGDAP